VPAGIFCVDPEEECPRRAATRATGDWARAALRLL
jgi:hypothetical protein